METKDNEIIGFTTDIVSAYVSNNQVPVTGLPTLIHEIYKALSGLGVDVVEDKQEDNELRPAVSIKRSIHSDYLICLEDGKKFKSLKRHLRTHYNLTPEQYREKWNLPSDYPMVAPNYAEARSTLAKQMGLGRNRRDG